MSDAEKSDEPAEDRWQYLRTTPALKPDDADELGAQGWEMVGVVADWVWFKRRVQ